MSTTSTEPLTEFSDNFTIIARSGRPVERSGGDMLAWPVLGAVLKSRLFMTVMRLAVLALFAYAVYFGFVVTDPEQNYITTGFFWGLFWPFFMLVSMALLGPVICTFCPHGFIGTYLTRWGLRKKLPKRWRNPYLGLAAVLVGYWLVYYAFAPFDSPLVTALFFLILTVAAIVCFLLFDGMAYCHYFCPMGSLKTAFGKLGLAWLSTYSDACKGCKSYDCAKACQYKLSPFNFDKYGSMETCTLCMDCAQACPSVSWRLKKPSFSLLSPIRRMREIDVWVYILLLAVITITMRFHHALGRSAIADRFPWSRGAQWLDQVIPALPANGIDTTGLVALACALVLTLAVSMGGLWLSALVLRQPFNTTFKSLGYALAPLMAIGGLSHVGEFYFLHYYSDIANAVNQLFALSDELVAPLARRGEPWLHSFVLFQYLAVIWSYYLFYRRISFIDVVGWRKWTAFPCASLITSVYLGLIFYTAYVFATYGAAVMRHH